MIAFIGFADIVAVSGALTKQIINNHQYISTTNRE